MTPPLSAEERMAALRDDLLECEATNAKHEAQFGRQIVPPCIVAVKTVDLRFLLDRCAALERALSQSEKLKATWGDMLTQSIDKVAALTADLDAIAETNVWRTQRASLGEPTNG